MPQSVKVLETYIEADLVNDRARVIKVSCDKEAILDTDP